MLIIILTTVLYKDFLRKATLTHVKNIVLLRVFDIAENENR